MLSQGSTGANLCVPWRMWHPAAAWRGGWETGSCRKSVQAWSPFVQSLLCVKHCAVGPLILPTAAPMICVPTLQIKEPIVQTDLVSQLAGSSFEDRPILCYNSCSVWDSKVSPLVCFLSVSLFYKFGPPHFCPAALPSKLEVLTLYIPHRHWYVLEREAFQVSPPLPICDSVPTTQHGLFRLLSWFCVPFLHCVWSGGGGVLMLYCDINIHFVNHNFTLYLNKLCAHTM